MNNSNTATNPILDFEGNQKNYLLPVYEGNDDPDFVIVSDGNTNGAQFELTYDSTLLKSVSFFNGNNEGPIRVHVYLESINGKSSPESYFINLNNALSFEWVHIDAENLSIVRDADQVIEIGIEYLDEGSMGYSDVNWVMSRSYLKPGGNIFRPLDNYELSGGTSLDGVWMIQAEMAVPLRYRPSDGTDGELSWAGISPTPFHPAEHNVLNIGYTYDGDNRITLEIFNTLGQRIYKTEDKRRAGLIYWNGTASNGTPVASGMYVLKLKSKRNAIYQKILLLR
jgi:hypothetical protein